MDDGWMMLDDGYMTMDDGGWWMIHHPDGK